MIENIRKLSLQDKKALLAMLQVDLGLMVNVDIQVEKPSLVTLETRRCNKVAEIKRSGGSVIYTEYQDVL
jgi:hypothetical protein